MNSKFLKELSALRDAQVISDEVLAKVQDHYTSNPKERSNKLLTIFGVLGALLCGLGLILILAHNWDNFSRTTKTIWAFTPLFIGHLFCGFSLFKFKSKTWTEASATFLLLGIGATISLVSQIYNIPGDLESFLLSWCLLAAPIIYLLRSYSATILYLILITSYAVTIGYGYNSGMPWYFIPLIAWVVPYYLKQIKKLPENNSTGILHWLFPISITIVLGAFLDDAKHLVLPIYVTLFGLYATLGKLPAFASLKLRTNGYAVLGSLGTVCTLSIATFRGFWEGSDELAFETPYLAFTVSSIAFVLLLWSFLYIRNYINFRHLFSYAFLVFAIIFFNRGSNPNIPMLFSNLILLALGISTIKRGVQLMQYSTLNYGLFIITLLVSYRFFDTQISFVIRGLVFISIGLGFFLTNYILYKKQVSSKQLN